MNRGEVWYAELPDPVGSGPGFGRPMLVVQSDTFTSSRLDTVVVIPLTSNVRLAAAPGNVFLPANVVPLDRDSVVNISAITSIDRSLFVTKYGNVPPDLMDEVDYGLRQLLDLY